jgi:hypothetical protein
VSSRPRREPAERFGRMDDNAVFARRAAILDRMARDDGKTGGYIQWTREDPNAGDLIRTGTVVSRKVGRAIGRLKDDARIIEELDQELSARGYSVEEVAGEYDRHCADLERAAIGRGTRGRYDVRRGGWRGGDSRSYKPARALSDTPGDKPEAARSVSVGRHDAAASRPLSP